MLKDGRIGGVPAGFTKMSGAGNDFLVFDERVSIGPREAETIRAVCRRGVGVGADGVLFVEANLRGERSRVLLDYFNADGSRARFCANGTRCVARFAKERLGAGAEMVVATDWGDVPATVRDGAVTLRLPEAVALGARVDSYDRGRRLLQPEAVAPPGGGPQLLVVAADGVEGEAAGVTR